MRNLLMALLVVGLVAAPSLGVVNVKITADKTNILVGESTTVYVWAQGTAAGLFSLGGSVNSSVAGKLSSTAGTLAFDPLYNPSGLLTPKPGTAGANGNWASVGTQQTDWGTPNANLGKADFVKIFSYQVKGAALGTTVLSFAGATVSGYKPLETDKTGVYGTFQPLTMNVVPEPITMALLAVGGLLVARRRR